MTIHAFKDSGDGYYQVDVPDGEAMPAWTESLTSCAVQTVAQTVTPPLTATPYQFKAALVQQGLYTQAAAAVAGADQLTQLAWSEAQVFLENDISVIKLATAIGKTAADIHALFQLASTLNP